MLGICMRRRKYGNSWDAWLSMGHTDGQSRRLPGYSRTRGSVLLITAQAHTHARDVLLNLSVIWAKKQLYRKKLLPLVQLRDRFVWEITELYLSGSCHPTVSASSSAMKLTFHKTTPELILNASRTKGRILTVRFLISHMFTRSMLYNTYNESN